MVQFPEGGKCNNFHKSKYLGIFLSSQRTLLFPGKTAYKKLLFSIKLLTLRRSFVKAQKL